MKTVLECRNLLIISFLIYSLPSFAVVGDHADGDIKTTACSVSVCKKADSNVHRSDSESHRLCEENNSSINWVTEEIVGTSEYDVLEQFRDLYYNDGKVNDQPNSFNTLVKKNWRCSNGDDQQGINPRYELLADTGDIESILSMINPHIRVSLASYEPSTESYTFTNLRYDDGIRAGRISLGNGNWTDDDDDVLAQEMCVAMGFEKGVSLNYGSGSGGDIVYIEPQTGAFDKHRSSSDYVVQAVTCKGNITKVFFNKN